MLANIAALAFTVALTAIGIWLAVSIADLRKTQDCVLMGRRDCARISATPQRQAVPETARFAAEIRLQPERPASIELRAPLRYTGTRLRPGEQGIPGPRRHLLKPFRIISNISKA